MINSTLSSNSSGTYQNYYSYPHYSQYIHKSRVGHTSDSQINSQSEPALQCSCVIVYFLPLLHIPTYLVQLVHNTPQTVQLIHNPTYDSSLFAEFFITMHLLVNNYCLVIAVHALLLYEAQNHPLFTLWKVSNMKQALLYFKKLVISLIILIIILYLHSTMGIQNTNTTFVISYT